MAIREMVTRLDSVLPPVQDITDNTVTFFPETGSVDMSGAGLGIVCHLFYGEFGSGEIALTLQHSDEATSGFVDVPAESTVHKNGLRDTNLSDQITGGATVVNLGAFSNKQFIRAKVTPTSVGAANGVRVLFNLFPEVIDGGVN